MLQKLWKIFWGEGDRQSILIFNLALLFLCFLGLMFCAVVGWMGIFLAMEFIWLFQACYCAFALVNNWMWKGDRISAYFRLATTFICVLFSFTFVADFYGLREDLSCLGGFIIVALTIISSLLI